MATWKEISSHEYKAQSGAGAFSVVIQYDNDSDTPESMKIRFKAERNSSYVDSAYSANGYYILYKPGASSEKLFTLKAPKKDWSDSVTTTVTLSKNYSTSKFTIPEFWICNTGSVTPDLEARTTIYGDVGKVSMYDCFTLNKMRGGTTETNGFVTRVSSFKQAGIEATDGTASKPVIKDNGNNTFTISGSITAGEHNAFSSAKLYYTTDGSDPTTSSSSKSISDDGSYSFTFNVPSSKSSSLVKAWISCSFKYNSVTATANAKTVLYYTNGSAAPQPVIKDNGNNTVTISGKVGIAGWNNPMTSATLSYTIAGVAYSAVLSTTDSASYSITAKVPAGNTTVSVKASVACKYNRNATVTSAQAITAKYYSVIGKPNVGITDNLDNTFTVTGTAATNGSNNNASTTYAWGYSTSYGNSGTGTKNLNIATPANDTRTVYAKATANPSWSYDTAKTATASLAVKQYVAPTEPGTPVIIYNKSRLTIKEPWKFSWKDSTSINSNSPLKGYRFILSRCPAGSSTFTDLTGIICNTKDELNPISLGNNSDIQVLVENTRNFITLNNPLDFGFMPGDKVQIRVSAFTRNGKNNIVQSAYIKSEEYLVKNAGIANVNIDGSWQEGQVWVNIDGEWKEAETVNVNVNSEWKESQ